MRNISASEPGKGNLIPVTGDYILEFLTAIQQNDVPVFEVLKGPDGTLKAQRIDPSQALRLEPEAREQKQFLIERLWKATLFSRTDTLSTELESLRSVPVEARVEMVRELRENLDQWRVRREEPAAKAAAIMNVVTKSFLVNKASLKESELDVTPAEKRIAKETISIVDTALTMAEDRSITSALFLVFKDLSNGQTVNHVARVFTSFTGLIHAYQDAHRKRLSSVVRKAFPRWYRPLYARLLPLLSDAQLTPDQILQFGPLEPWQKQEYSLGAFLHDIGKMGNIDYFESAAEYDAEQIQQHVFLGSGLILMNYGNEHDGARLLAGDHHNQLGHPAGYSVTRLEQQRSVRPLKETIRVISTDSDGFTSGEAKGWLPVELLAVADVYDAMTDPSRVYKKPMTPAEAVVFLEDVQVAQGKLDPVLVDLFIDYLRDQGLEVPADRGLQFKSEAV